MNAFLPGLLQYEENLRKTDPIIRQVFYVHNAYILLVLAFIGAVCVLLPGELITGGRLATVLNGFFMLFWGLRLVIQMTYYDRTLKNRFYALHLLFTTAIGYLTVLFFWLFLRHVERLI
jgi:uncharacterized membrane protein